jgi:micrococcal nuclease
MFGAALLLMSLRAPKIEDEIVIHRTHAIQRFITLIGLICVCLSLGAGVGQTFANNLAKKSSWPGVPGVLAGPVMARVIRVYDGDTILVRARIWVDQEIEIRVRLSGVDTPEIKGQCAGEETLALKARDFVIEKIGHAPVRLHQIHYGKYAGRVVARIMTGDHQNLSALLIRAGHGRQYDGRRRGSWCRD